MIIPSDEEHKAHWMERLSALDESHKKVVRTTPELLIRAGLLGMSSGIDTEMKKLRLTSFEEDCETCRSFAPAYIDSALQTYALKQEKIQEAIEWLERKIETK